MTTTITGAGGINRVIDGADMPAGSVIQVVQSGTIAFFSTTTTGSWLATNTTMSITPSATSSKVLVTVNQPALLQGSSLMRCGFRIKRGSTVIWNTDGFVEHMQVRNADNEHNQIITLVSLDSPSSTSSVTYSVEMYLTSGSAFHFRDSDDSGSIMVLQEIAG
tara:strand:- start:332 stop:820 length:489 start_codon:yes stop_codon:yes gene_type:complete